MRTRLCLGLVAVVALLALGRTPAGAVSLTFTVNTTASDHDGTCAPLTAATDCTLREAINAANTNPDLDTIRFDIPGTGPHTITVTSELPAITSPVVLDGTTEPDHRGSPVVEVSGGGTVKMGLVVYAADSAIRGLVINRFGQGVWIAPESPGRTRIEGNYIGTTVSGTAAAPNTEYGIVVQAPGVTVGGTTPGVGNVISGNTVGLSVTVGGTGTVVAGNLIGTDATGVQTGS